MFVTNWISTTKIQKISEITNFFRHYFLSRTEVNTTKSLKMATTGETEPNTSWEGWLSKGITTWRRCITIVKI